MTWIEQGVTLVGAVLVLTAVLVLPGAGLLWLARVRGILGWALGASVTAAVYGVSGVLLSRLGVPWGPVGVLAVLVPLAAVAAVVGRWRRREPALRCAPVPSVTRRLTWAGAVAAGVLLATGLLVGMPDAAAPLQVRDAVVHVNALELVRQQHDASMFGGLDLVVSQAGGGSFYPSVWHGALALVPFGTSGLVTTAGVLTVCAVLWPLAMVALTRAVFPGDRWASPVVALLSGAFSFFPFAQTVLSAQMPNALGTSMIPAVLAVTVLWVRSCQEQAPHSPARRRAQLAGGVVVAVGLVGMGLAHPNTVFSYAVVAVPFLLAVCWRSWRRAGFALRPLLQVGGVVVVLAAGAAVAVSTTGLGSVLRSVTAYEQVLPTRSYAFTTARVLLDTGLAIRPGNIVLSVLVLTGVVALVRGRRLRWIVLAWATTLALAALAGGPENPLRGLTGVWYKHVFRLEALYPITALLLVVVGLGWWARALHGWWGARWPWRSPTRAGATVVVAAVVLSGGLQVVAVADRSAGVYDPDRLGSRLVATADDRALLERLPSLVPEDAVVLGDPNGGAVYVYSYGGRTPVYYRLGTDHVSDDQKLLATSLDAIGEDPAVCAALGRLGVTHLYVSDGIDVTTPANAATSALRDVDTSEGFELVASQGTAHLYRITACD